MKYDTSSKWPLNYESTTDRTTLRTLLQATNSPGTPMYTFQTKLSRTTHLHIRYLPLHRFHFRGPLFIPRQTTGSLTRDTNSLYNTTLCVAPLAGSCRITSYTLLWPSRPFICWHCHRNGISIFSLGGLFNLYR